MVPITSCFIILLTWCDRGSITSSWNLPANVSRSSSSFWAHPGYQLDSWWEIPSLPSMNCIIIDYFIAFPPTQACSCLVLYLEFLATQHLIFLTSEVLPSLLSRMWWEFHHLLIILDIIILLAIFVHSLVPVLFSTGIPTMELWHVNSKLLATLLLEVNGQ